MKSSRFQKVALLAAVSFIAMGADQALAQDASPSDSDEDQSVVIVVTGVRASQEAGIGIKRENAAIVDAIVADDIGKLPDVTIADALQRISGVQIDRSAGEGNTVSIRGQRDVLATLNGERFLTAEGLLQPRAAFQDVPASLVSGVNVYKSFSASQLDGGIGGIIDLQTRRAVDLEDGLTVVGSVQGNYGDETKQLGYQAEGTIGYNWGNGIAMSLSASYSDRSNANNSQSTEQDYVDEYSTWMCGGGCGDLNGDGDASDFFLTPLGWSASVLSTQNDRQRLGLAYNFSADVGDSIEVSADVFYNRMDER